MAPIKFTWGKDDTLSTIHQRLLQLVGKQVVSWNNERNSFIIFNVSEITNMEFVSSMKAAPMWGFSVRYGYEDPAGRQNWMYYDFMIPRTGTYQEDLKQNGLMIDAEHPFLFYQLK